jgi:ketosteroid isomerase-like protein
MKHVFTTAALLLITMFSFSVKAQQVSEKDQADIKKVYADFTAAFEKSDAQATVNLYTSTGIHIDPQGKIVRGHKDLLEYHVGLFKWFKTFPRPDKTTHTDTDWESHYLAPGVISVTYTSEDISTYGDKTRSDKFSISVILKRTGDKWLADQVTMTPVVARPE